MFEPSSVGLRRPARCNKGGLPTNVNLNYLVESVYPTPRLGIGACYQSHYFGDSGIRSNQLPEQLGARWWLLRRRDDISGFIGDDYRHGASFKSKGRWRRVDEDISASIVVCAIHSPSDYKIIGWFHEAKNAIENC